MALPADYSPGAIIPEAFQREAEDVVILRVESVSRIQGETNSRPDDKTRELVVIRGTVEGVVWSDSGLGTSAPVSIKIALDHGEIAKKIAADAKLSGPRIQPLYPEIPEELFETITSTAPIWTFAFLKKTTKEHLKNSTTNWAGLSESAKEEIERDTTFFAPGAHQYSFSPYSFFGPDWKELVSRMIELSQRDHAADVVVLFKELKATAFKDEIENGLTVQLPPGMSLEWLGAQSQEKDASHWAYGAGLQTLYQLHIDGQTGGRPQWITRTCDLENPSLREAAIQFASTENMSDQPVRKMAATLRLNNYHTRTGATPNRDTHKPNN